MFPAGGLFFRWLYKNGTQVKWFHRDGLRLADKVAKATAATAAPAGKIMRLKLADVATDAGTQIRAALDSETVAEYASAMLDGARFPAAIVFQNGPRFLLADGFHRVAAAVRNGFTDFAFDVRSGSKPEALKFALSANAQHGLKRTNADKRRSVELALTEWPKLSSAEIARICAVSHTFVEGLRSEIQPATVAGCGRIGHDGKERKLPPVPVRPSVPPVPTQPSTIAQSVQSDAPTVPSAAAPDPPPWAGSGEPAPVLGRRGCFQPAGRWFDRRAGLRPAGHPVETGQHGPVEWLGRTGTVLR